MTDHWEKSNVYGLNEKGIPVEETVLHRRGVDPMVMAFRRNLELTGCHFVGVETEEAFTQIRGEEGRRRNRREIRREGERFDEWSW